VYKRKRIDKHARLHELAVVEANLLKRITTKQSQHGDPGPSTDSGGQTAKTPSLSCQLR